MARPQTHPELENFLLQAIAEPGRPDVAGSAAQAFGLTRQTVNRRLRELVADGLVNATGSTRSRRYELVRVEAVQLYPIQGLEEHRVWEEFVRPHLDTLPENVRSICQYGLTEMVNNAIDHSEGTRATVVLQLDVLAVRMFVGDDGIGIFKKIKDAFELDSESDVILELSKGKLTTDPSRHSGEGIFFTSRAFDTFSLYSGDLFFHHFPDNDDWLMDRGEIRKGTLVVMEISPSSSRKLNDVFDRFAAPDQFHFDVTHVPVKLAQIGEDSLVSRSQGKRLVARFEKFSKVVLNFADVSSVGQAFADEVFRVFPSAHPNVQLTAINMTSAVRRMVRRVSHTESDNLET